MATIKELTGKITSLKNTRKITKAMKMIAATKLRRAQQAVENSEPFAKGLKSMLATTLTGMDEGKVLSPLVVAKDEVKKIHLMLFTSDRGLCGPFNSNVLKETAKLIHEKREAGIDVKLFTAGKKGNDFFSKRLGVEKNYAEAIKLGNVQEANAISEDLTSAFLESEADEVYLIFNEFKSAISQVPKVEKLFPLDPYVEDGEVLDVADVIFEPSPEALVEKLILQAVSFSVYRALLNSLASEHASRMTAMDNATNNAGDLIDKYTLLKNRARQAAITTELTEIISGAESLKG